MKRLSYLLFLLCLSSCISSTEEKSLKITLTNIGFESNHMVTSNDIVIYEPYIVYFSFEVQNTFEKPINVGTYNNRYSDSGSKYGIFYVQIGNEQFALNSTYASSYYLMPGDSMEFTLDYDFTDSENRELLKYFYFSSDSVNNPDSLLKLFNQWEIIYVPIGEGYEKDPFPEEITEVKIDHFTIVYTSWDEKHRMWLEFSKKQDSLYIKEIN